MGSGGSGRGFNSGAFAGTGRYCCSLIHGKGQTTCTFPQSELVHERPKSFTFIRTSEHSAEKTGNFLIKLILLDRWTGLGQHHTPLQKELNPLLCFCQINNKTALVYYSE